MIVAISDTKYLDKEFQWKDIYHNFHYPKDMETRHIFFTLRMIWNHTMPQKIGTYVIYTFSEFYTPEYFKKAIVNLAAELLTRTDLQESWKSELRAMVGIVNKQSRLANGN